MQHGLSQLLCGIVTQYLRIPEVRLFRDKASALHGAKVKQEFHQADENDLMLMMYFYYDDALACDTFNHMWPGNSLEIYPVLPSQLSGIDSGMM